MKKRTRSILDELNQVHGNRDNDLFIDSTANNIIERFNPDKNFLPSPGPIIAWAPSKGGKARFDSGVETGSEITTDFDPMIAKVTVHAPTRREAAARLARVLETTRIQGLTTNRDFLVNTLRTDEYIAGDTTTDFIERVNPARTIEIDETSILEAALIENIQREDLNAIEEAEGYAILNSKHGLSHDEIANTIGKKRTTISNALRLLKLPPEVRKSIREGKISAGHGRAILQKKTISAMQVFWKKIINDSLSVRAAEALVRPLGKVKKIRKVNAVSYTHLTLPTIYSV